MRIRLMLASAIALLLLLAACEGDVEMIDDDAAAPADDPAAEDPAAEDPAAEDPAAEDVDVEVEETLSGEGIPEFISIATGGTGGAYYPIGGAAGALLAEGIEGVRSGVAETTGGSVENMQLLHRERSEIILAQGDAVYDGWHGNEPFDEPHDTVRTIAMVYVNVGQWVTTADRGIESFEDLVGQRFSTGDAGSGTEVFTMNVLEALGIDHTQIEIQRLSFDDQTAAIRNDQLDAGSWIVAPGASSIQDLASSEDIHVIPFSDEEVETVLAEHPYYVQYTLEAGTYQGQDEDVQTVGTWNSFLMHENASEDFAYAVTKLLHENPDVLAQGHPSGGDIDPQNINEALTPLHPGAIRYFEEIGVELDEELRPDGAGG